jgi:hypothetical protein
MDPSSRVASIAALALATVTISYIIACVVVPWGRCRKCHGTGHKPRRGGRVTRTWCRRCEGTGRRVRVGRRIWNLINREYRAGTR